MQKLHTNFSIIQNCITVCVHSNSRLLPTFVKFTVRFGAVYNLYKKSRKFRQSEIVTLRGIG